MNKALDDVLAERERIGGGDFRDHLVGWDFDAARAEADNQTRFWSLLNNRGEADWHGLLLGRVHLAGAERYQGRLRKALVQTAAVALAWIDSIDRRT